MVVVWWWCGGEILTTCNSPITAVWGRSGGVWRWGGVETQLTDNHGRVARHGHATVTKALHAHHTHAE